jgi:hypothetical protein
VWSSSIPRAGCDADSNLPQPNESFTKSNVSENTHLTAQFSDRGQIQFIIIDQTAENVNKNVGAVDNAAGVR